MDAAGAKEFHTSRNSESYYTKVKYSELGPHARDAPHKPRKQLLKLANTQPEELKF